MADPICRWRNPYIKTIVELVRILPHKVMPSNEYRTIVENRWPGFLHTAYQLACQVGLYYESDDGFYYPRFDHDIDEGEAYTYMQRWIRRYYVPNPYTKSMRTLQQPKPFLASIIEYIYEHPDEKELHSILENVFQEDIGNIDIISNVLNTYTDLMKVADNGNVELTEKAKDFMNKFIDRNDKKAFFDNFSEEAIETIQEELLRHSLAAKFLREALTIVIEDDANLSKLAALNRYRETNKQLKINGFNLWRKKDDLPSRLKDVYQDLEIEYNGQKYVMYLEWDPASMESLFFPVFNNAYSGMFAMSKEGNDYVLYKVSQSNGGEKKKPLQQIFYGAPGTGKSHLANEQTKGKSVIRTTFHPDSDYSTFVGAYKPTTIDETAVNFMGREAVPVRNADGNIRTENKIIYEFVPQAFMQAYVNAWKLYCEAQSYLDMVPPKEQYLIIEEINRGNCAQIFGDLFQLLDRGDKGFSCYPIQADKDIQKHLAKEFSNIEFPSSLASEFDGYDGNISEDLKSGKVLVLPNNLYIWATMNTSDQSLFPIDSAFKRRWDWDYRPIGYKNSNWTIEIGDKKYNWVDFQKAINQKIYDVDNSEDKQLGDYFVNADRTGFKISADTLLNKILFYIWNDVCKDDPDQIFRCKIGKEEESVKFSDFFGADKVKKLQGFMAFNGVPTIGESENASPSEPTQDAEEAAGGDTNPNEDNEVNA